MNKKGACLVDLSFVFSLVKVIRTASCQTFKPDVAVSLICNCIGLLGLVLKLLDDGVPGIKLLDDGVPGMHPSMLYVSITPHIKAIFVCIHKIFCELIRY